MEYKPHYIGVLSKDESFVVQKRECNREQDEYGITAQFNSLYPNQKVIDIPFNNPSDREREILCQE